MQNVRIYSFKNPSLTRSTFYMFCLIWKKHLNPFILQDTIRREKQLASVFLRPKPNHDFNVFIRAMRLNLEKLQCD